MQLFGAFLGLNQLNKPAPLNYRKLTNVIIVVLLPATVTLIHEWGTFSDAWLHRIDQLAIYVGALMKGFGLVLGNGQKYTPSNEAIEKKQEENKS